MISFCEQCGSFHPVYRGALQCPHANQKREAGDVRVTCEGSTELALGIPRDAGAVRAMRNGRIPDLPS